MYGELKMLTFLKRVVILPFLIAYILIGLPIAFTIGCLMVCLACFTGRKLHDDFADLFYTGFDFLMNQMEI